MRLISSRWTFFYKRIFPAIWFGLMAVFIAISLFATGPRLDQLTSALGVIAPLLMAVVGFVVMRMFIFDLVDEVWDDGTALIVKNGGQEQRIALSDIKNVNYSPFVSPPRTTLLLRHPAVFGSQVTFCAPVRFLPLTRSPAIDDLIERVDAARLKQL